MGTKWSPSVSNHGCRQPSLDTTDKSKFTIPQTKHFHLHNHPAFILPSATTGPSFERAEYPLSWSLPFIDLPFCLLVLIVSSFSLFPEPAATQQGSSYPQKQNPLSHFVHCHLFLLVLARRRAFVTTPLMAFSR